MISSISSLLLSILERSRILLIISRRFSEDFSIISTNSLCSSSKPVSLRSSVNPTMPFKGVLISWDIFARNIDFASLASWAEILSFLVCSIIASRSSYASVVPLAECKLILVLWPRVSSAALLSTLSKFLMFFAISLESRYPNIAKIIDTNQIVMDMIKSFKTSSWIARALLSIIDKTVSSAWEIMFTFSDNIVNQILESILYFPVVADEIIEALCLLILLINSILYGSLNKRFNWSTNTSLWIVS